MDTVGPISRTVEDAAITLGAIAGYDPKDPYTWNTPVPDYRHALDGNIKGMKIGVVRELINSQMVESEVREAVVRATAVLGELGASVEEVSIPLTRHANAISSVMVSVEPALNHHEWIRERLQDYGHDNRIGLLTGSIMPAQAYYKAQKLRSLLRQQVHEGLERYDVLVTPTSGRTAVPRTETEPVITSKEMASRLPYMLTNTFNLASAPAISVPCGFSSQGLPIGLQIGGRPGAEETVLKVAHAYEQSTPWHTMRPPAA
jgi:aspartyl-tRNA(Asn)/glutamyl-tRNA(Gln) amidotransferase subunit A